MKIPPVLQQWQSEGWLRSIDVAFAQLLVELAGEDNENVLVAAALTSFYLGAGHVCVDWQALLKTPEQFLPQVLPKDGQPQAGWRPFVSALQKKGLAPLLRELATSAAIGSGEGSEPLVLEGHRLYLRRYWCYEKQVADALRARMHALPSQVDDASAGQGAAQISTALTALFGAQTDEIDWQRVATVVASQQRFAVISGGPGTGKTTTVVRLLSLLQTLARSTQGRALRVALAAPTGKAAARLTESIGSAVSKLSNAADIPTQVTTLHRLIGARPDTREFVRHRGNPLHIDILVIDEASMVDLEMMAAVVDALPPHARLIMLGDKDQLASVEAGAILGEICRDAHHARYSAALCEKVKALANIPLPSSDRALPLDDHIVTLKKSHRFSSQGGIGQLAHAINAGDVKATLRLLASGDPQVDFRQGASLDAMIKPLVLDPHMGYAASLTAVSAGCPPQMPTEVWAAEMLKLLGRFQVLCALRQGAFGVDALNQLIAGQLQAAGLLAHTVGWYAGRPVMVTRNDYALGLMNGDVGITLPDPTADNALRVFFAQPQGIKRVLPSRLTQVDTVFAMTVHKSQGSEFLHACLVLPDSNSPVLTQELIYTAVTRAKERVTLVGTRANVLEEALAQRVFRCSGLWERLTAADTDARAENVAEKPQLRPPQQLSFLDE